MTFPADWRGHQQLRSAATGIGADPVIFRGTLLPLRLPGDLDRAARSGFRRKIRALSDIG